MSDSNLNAPPARRTDELIARAVVLLLIAAVLVLSLISWQRRDNKLVLHARMPENGGWQPVNLQAEVGQPLEIQLTSDDVLHSFAIGQSDRPAVDIYPGENTNITLHFDRPGRYVFYCTRWCGANHWRMRGVIEVTADAAGGEAAQEVEAIEPPLYVQLGLNLDQEHHTDRLPARQPSAAKGAVLAAKLPERYLFADFYRAASPAEAWQALRDETGELSALEDHQIWDLVAYIWALNTSSTALQEGQFLYRENCAACHGETGAGDGVFANTTSENDTHAPEDSHAPDEPAQMADGSLPPTDFTDSSHMLAASPAVLQGKIVRGGMGAGMPYWGPIFTEEQTWALVSYLWSFQFDLNLTEMIHE